MSENFALFPVNFPVSGEFGRQRDVIGGLQAPPGKFKKESYSEMFFFWHFKKD
jgi:hypothetical protein